MNICGTAKTGRIFSNGGSAPTTQWYIRITVEWVVVIL
jgi:hypothetical protein